MDIFKKILNVLFLCMIAVSIYAFYHLFQQKYVYQQYKRAVSSGKKMEQVPQQQPTQPVAQSGKSTSPTTWLDVQRQVKDTVVQVFSQICEFNWLEPYKTPEQGEGRGSGFFINENGDLITNYHVVAQSSGVQIQIPTFGHEQFDVKIIGVSPERDIALLSLTKESKEKIIKKLGKIPYLTLGDSDRILRSQEVLALGYPLGQTRLKSTLGIVSGRERLGIFGYIQITAPLNPGNSGGPALNAHGEVIGINSRGVIDAQNVGYIIPIDEVKSALNDLYKVKLLRRPTLGCLFTIASPELVSYLGNPDDGGWFIAKVFDNTLLKSVGVQENDMLYEINGYRIDLYGDLNVPWSEDKVNLLEVLNRLKIGEDVHIVVYRKGTRKVFNFKLEHKYLPKVRVIYSEFEPEATDYEVIGGMVVMQLNLNHVGLLIPRVPEKASDLSRYSKIEQQQDAALIITHILPNSQAYKAQILQAGEIITDVNDIPVTTLKDFRDAIKKSKKSRFLTIRTDDKYYCVLSVDKIVKEEDQLASRFFFKKSKLLDEIA
jgi:serine protease Do